MKRNYIKEYRILRGIRSQTALAKLAGVPKSTLGEIERHKMVGSLETLKKIAHALGITSKDLFARPE